MKTVSSKVRLLCCALLLTCTGVAHAWNNFGHMLVARIAWENMSPEQRTQATEILKGLGADYDMLTKGKPANVDEDLFAFLKAATWPDMIRSPGSKLHTEHRAKWHYINYPIELDNVNGPTPSAAWKVGDNPTNAVQALKRCEHVLKSSQGDTKERAIALCWMLHLIGDIHQPLHATALFSNDFPEGDRGGNLFIVDLNNKQIVLHTYWDTLLGVSNSPGVVNKRLIEYMQKPELRRTAFAAALKLTAYDEWAKESLALALETAYEDGSLRGQNEELLKEDPSLTVPVVDLGYADDAFALARKRVCVAGYRMAEKLSAVIGP
jgi:hypothetical protein